MVGNDPEPHGSQAPPTLDGADQSDRPYSTDGGYCGQDGCSLTTPNREQDETRWEDLFAGLAYAEDRLAVPFEPREYVTPTQADFTEILDAVQPPAKHALYVIRGHWSDEIQQRLQTIGGELRDALGEVKHGWRGDDFDAFAEQVEATAEFVAQIEGDVDTVRTGLTEYADDLREQQGFPAGAPFPAARLHVKKEGGFVCTDYKVHIRPPWHQGECHVVGAEEAAFVMQSDMAGLGEDFRNSVGEWTAHYQECTCTPDNPDGPHEALEEPRSPGEAEIMAQQAMSNIVSPEIDAEVERYESFAADASDDLNTRLNNVNEAYGSDHPNIDPNSAPPANLPGERPDVTVPGMSPPPPMGDIPNGDLPGTDFDPPGVDGDPPGRPPDPPSDFDPDPPDDPWPPDGDDDGDGDGDGQPPHEYRPPELDDPDCDLPPPPDNDEPIYIDHWEPPTLPPDCPPGQYPDLRPPIDYVPNPDPPLDGEYGFDDDIGGLENSGPGGFGGGGGGVGTGAIGGSPGAVGAVGGVSGGAGPAAIGAGGRPMFPSPPPVAAGAAGRGVGGGMLGPGRSGAAAQSADGGGSVRTWLTEDEDVWGAAADDDVVGRLR